MNSNLEKANSAVDRAISQAKVLNDIANGYELDRLKRQAMASAVTGFVKMIAIAVVIVWVFMGWV